MASAGSRTAPRSGQASDATRSWRASTSERRLPGGQRLHSMPYQVPSLLAGCDLVEVHPAVLADLGRHPGGADRGRTGRAATPCAGARSGRAAPRPRRNRPRATRAPRSLRPRPGPLAAPGPPGASAPRPPPAPGRGSCRPPRRPLPPAAPGAILVHEGARHQDGQVPLATQLPHRHDQGVAADIRHHQVGHHQVDGRELVREHLQPGAPVVGPHGVDPALVEQLGQDGEDEGIIVHEEGARPPVPGGTRHETPGLDGTRPGGIGQRAGRPVSLRRSTRVMGRRNGSGRWRPSGAALPLARTTTRSRVLAGAQRHGGPSPPVVIPLAPSRTFRGNRHDAEHSFLATAIALLALAACATPAGPSTGAAPAAAPATAGASASARPSSQPKVVCQNETPLGSHIAKRVCRPVEQVDRDRQATQTDLLRPRSTPTQPGN